MPTAADATSAMPAARAALGAGTRSPGWVIPDGFHLTHPERVIDASSGTTKGELVVYFATVSALMLPHLKDRPVALLRATAGVGGPQFFQKHVESTAQLHVRQLDPSLDPGHPGLLEITDLDGLLSTAQMNTIELHTWNSTTRSITTPDRIVFDLDPGEGVAFDQVKASARLVQAMLVGLGLACFLKTSGGKGLHVVVPLGPRLEWQMVRRFAQVVVERLAEAQPQLIVAKSGARNRVGKVYVDYLRNGWGATTACAWSTRARAGLGVSVPIAWDELDAVTSGAHWTLANVSGRLPVGNTPWDDFAKSRQTLTKAVKTLGLDLSKEDDDAH